MKTIGKFFVLLISVGIITSCSGDQDVGSNGPQATTESIEEVNQTAYDSINTFWLNRLGIGCLTFEIGDRDDRSTYRQ